MAGNGNPKSLANLKPAWKPGESGNMDGRPLGVKNRATTARLWLEVDENIKNPITGVDERLTQEDILTLAQIKSARSGDTQAYKALMDSAYGAPKVEVKNTVVSAQLFPLDPLSDVNDSTADLSTSQDSGVAQAD